MSKKFIPLYFIIWVFLVFTILINYDSVLPQNLLLDVNTIVEFDFLETNKLYLILHLITFLPVFLLSFDKKVHYFKQWRSLFPAIMITALFFIIWDIVFTQKGVWGFNEKYILPIKIAGLPLGEIFFFFTVPFATVFIYQCLKYYWKTDFSFFPEKKITITILILCSSISIFKLSHIYTATTLLLTIGMLLINIFYVDKKIKSRFYFAYVITLLPFLLVNGVLTGAFTQEPVVIYNPEEYLGIRIFTIPLDDAIYSFLLFLMNINLFEYFEFQLKKII